ncbi:TetR/AcrR family transcriptional regulator [Natrialbaceae archaeon A-gly3]
MAVTFFENPEGTREEILAATYRALCDHGYSELTISRIGEEFEKSPSLVYHHYESKDELVLECLEFMLEGFEEQMTDDIDEPRVRLEEFFEWVLEPDVEPERQSFIALLVELRALASREDAYRRHFTRSDRIFEQYLTRVVESGIDGGEFKDCDPERVATWVLTTLSGVMLRRSTQDHDPAWLENVRTEIDSYLEGRVYRG